MKHHFFIALLLSSFTPSVFAQQNNSKQVKHKAATLLPHYDKYLLLEPTPDTTANVSIADFNGDGHLDLLLVKGRHWPMVDRVLLGDGKGGIKKAYDLGKIADRSYSGVVADFNGDKLPDIAISNDAPDKKLVYLNDGKGNFTVGSAFGDPQWPTRNAAVADINKDGLPDLIAANRGDIGDMSNYFCLNNGKGQFSTACTAFAPYPATTITPADINKDGFVDMVVPHRDSGQSYIYLGSAAFTYTDALRIPFGPAQAAIRQAAVADINGDGLPDIVTVDEFKGVDIYFQQKDKSFAAAGVSVADAKLVPYAVAIADLNKDGKPDIIVGHVETASTVYYNNGSGKPFTPVYFGDEKGTVCGFAIRDFNGDGILDIAAARSGAISVLYYGGVK
ncbi:MAG: VCBS repeat-containing protein [Chitinophagaceae bacterium]